MPRIRALELFVVVCQKPTMFVQCARFSAVSAYIDGYDTALAGGALVGFREWLLIGGKEWTNLPWWCLIRLRMDPNTDLSSPPSEEEEVALIGELRLALEGFLRAQKEGGLDNVFREYHAWLSRKSGPVGRMPKRRPTSGSKSRR